MFNVYYYFYCYFFKLNPSRNFSKNGIKTDPNPIGSKIMDEVMEHVRKSKFGLDQRELNMKGGYALNGNGPWLGMSALHWAKAGISIVVNALLEIPEIDINIQDA